MSALPDTTAAPAPRGAAPELTFAEALAGIARRADALDESPRFPSENFEDLRSAGVLALAGARRHGALVHEGEVIRALAAADSSTARILDGHFNGSERLALLGDSGLRERELAQIARGELLLGVWGADPTIEEGPAARIERDGSARVLTGLKTFCSGAGGVDRALVVVRDEEQRRRVAYVDGTRGLRIDRDWYRGSGLRASESHRVEFERAPVIALLGGPDELTREPWFSRDALRTAATWAGIADALLSAAAESLAQRTPDQLQLQAVGRMRLAQGSIDRWLGNALAELDAAVCETDARAALPQAWRTLSAEARLAIAQAARSISEEAVRLVGSRTLVRGGGIDRAHRDLDLFLLQHRLEPKLSEIGAQVLEERAR